MLHWFLIPALIAAVPPSTFGGMTACVIDDSRAVHRRFHLVLPVNAGTALVVRNSGISLGACESTRGTGRKSRSTESSRAAI